MSPSLINLGALPGHDMEPETIRSGAVRLRSAGSEAGTASAAVVKTWHRLDHVYEAPESGLLLAAMDPVKSSGATLSEHLGSAASALETFAGEVETIKQAVAAIQADALTFFATIRGGKSTVPVHSTRDGDTTKQVDWWDDPEAARQNNALLDRVTAQAELLSAAEDRCSATLIGLAEDVFPGSENGGPGYWKGPPAWSENPPWGEPVRIPELFEDPLGRAVKKLGAETVAGFTGLAGYDTSGYHYDLDKTFAEQDPMWTGGRTWARTGIALMGLATFVQSLNPGTELANITSRLVTGQPGAWDGEKAKLAFVKGFVASGDWRDHPGEAFFETAINVASLPVSWSKLGMLGKVGDVSRVTTQTSDAARAAAEAGEASEALRLARAAARGTDRIALPTVDGWKALTKGSHFDTAWAKNVDKIDVEIKVPDHGVNADRPNIPGEHTGVPAGNVAPAPRSAPTHVHAPEPAKVPAAAEHPGPRVHDRGESEVSARERDLVKVGATAEHRTPGAGANVGDGAKATSDRPATSAGSTAGSGVTPSGDLPRDGQAGNRASRGRGLPPEAPEAGPPHGDGSPRSSFSKDASHPLDVGIEEAKPDAYNGVDEANPDNAHPVGADEAAHAGTSAAGVEKLTGSTKGFSWETSEGKQAWLDKAKMDPEHTRVVAGTRAQDEFQRAVVGNPEVRLLRVKGERIWADGVGIDPDKVVALDAKYSGHPTKAMYEGKAPPFMQERLMEQFDDELRRYALAIRSPENPVQRLRIITSTPEAAEYVGARARRILGPDIDLQVVVKRWKP